MNKATVDVIVPCYNTGRYLRQAIDSALAQTYTALEVLVVDDGSTDNTREIVESYRGRVNYYYQENRGLAGARNAGLALTSGEYVCFLDADDVILPHMIEEQLQALRHNRDADICHGRTLTFTGDDLMHPVAETWRPHRQWNDYLEPLSVICAIHLGSSLIRKQCIENAGGFREMPEQGCEDWAFWLSCALTGTRFIHVPRVHGLYRTHDSSMSAAQEAIAARETGLMRLAVSLFHDHRVTDIGKRGILSFGIKRVALLWATLNRRDRYNELVELSESVLASSEQPHPGDRLFAGDRSYPESVLYLVLTHRLLEAGLTPLAVAMFLNCGDPCKLRQESIRLTVSTLFDEVVERLSCVTLSDSDDAQVFADQRSTICLDNPFGELELRVPHGASLNSYLNRRLAVLDKSLGFPDSALIRFRAAVRQNPNSDYGYFDLGTASLEQGYYAEAEMALRRCLELNPCLKAARFELATTLSRTGKLCGAASALLAGTRLDPDLGTDWMLGVLDSLVRRFSGKRWGQVERSAVYKIVRQGSFRAIHLLTRALSILGGSDRGFVGGSGANKN